MCPLPRMRRRQYLGCQPPQPTRSLLFETSETGLAHSLRHIAPHLHLLILILGERETEDEEKEKEKMKTLSRTSRVAEAESLCPQEKTPEGFMS